MKKSPSVFKESQEFIHFKKSITDTGIELNQLALIVYIELEKCLKYIKNNGYKTENKELCEWLLLLADVNDEEVQRLTAIDQEKSEIIEELYQISQNKEDLMAMLSEKYAEATRSSELVEARREGEKRGRLLGEYRSKIELIMKNHENFSAEAASGIFVWDRAIVDEVYRILDKELGRISVDEMSQRLVEGGFIEEPTFE